MWSFLEKLLQVVIPEDERLLKLLSLDPSTLRKILPRSNLSLKDASAIFDYQNKLVRLLVKSVKFRNNPQSRKIVASLIYEDLLEIISDKNLFDGRDPLVIPMPMSQKEKRDRGYNQCEEILKEMMRLDPAQIKNELNLIQKIRDTKRQVHLSREERLRNLEGAMQVFDPREVLNGRDVVIVDDLYTTGSTFAEARRALLLGGAKSVYGLFIAH